MSRALLVLATDPGPDAALPQLARALDPLLCTLGLAGEPIERFGKPARLVGARFFHLVSFLGCSPRLATEPRADGEFCHISTGLAATTRWRLGRNSRPPRCPKCRERAQCPLPPPEELTCDRCGFTTGSHAWDWQRGGGRGRLFVEIHGIYPAEAVPSPELLQQLEQATASPWDYLYLLDED